MYNQRRNKEDYVFEDIQPNIPEINLEELEKIQRKIEAFTSGRSKEGLTSNETKDFLDWVTYNARNYAVSVTGESILTASMAGECATTQLVNKELLTKLGLDVRAFNTSGCLGEIPMNEADKERVKNGWSTHEIAHSILLVNIPVIDENGNTQMHKFLLDPTFRQFCLKENCNEEKFDEEKWVYYNCVAPHPAFFMQKENLRRLGESEEYANDSENLCKTIIHNGYFLLNEKTAKLYGDAFVRASKRLEFQDVPIHMSGNDYIHNFENIPMNTYRDNSTNLYTRLPSEIIEAETGFFKKIVKFFKEKFAPKPKMLPSGTDNSTETNVKKQKLKVTLNDEQMANYREGESQILQKYANGEGKQINNISRSILPEK